MNQQVIYKDNWPAIWEKIQQAPTWECDVLDGKMPTKVDKGIYPFFHGSDTKTCLKTTGPHYAAFSAAWSQVDTFRTHMLLLRTYRCPGERSTHPLVLGESLCPAGLC